MTVAEQLALNANETVWHRLWRALQFVVALTVIVMAIVLVNVNQRASNTAAQAAKTANQVDTALEMAQAYTCKARSTILRTAPMTVREIRSVIDSESAQARLICPKLDYADLKLQRDAEIALLKAGADPTVVAAQGD